MIRVVRETTAESEEWIVKRHTREHNQSLLSKEEVSLLHAFRFICPEDGDRIKLLKRAGLKISDILNVLRLEKSEILSFNSRDVRNLLSKEFVGSGDQGSTRDVGDLLKILKEKSERDCKFFYDFTVDEDGRLENIVWIPRNAKQMACVFADVVVIDTTYRLNRYSMPFGCFAAVNNHGQTVILGAQTQLHEFIDAFDQVIGSRIEAEKKATLRDKLGTFRSVTSTKFEEQAYRH
ncbi:hypothetical protein R1sor_018914 [Riccia sorocarpa]|uniref:FAR1-related sequence 11-like HTH-like domain-containing protein n=1 Tax=Riccia sorocarpa TaxID=122646 RepID=A0ABD3IB78_9MARC